MKPRLLKSLFFLVFVSLVGGYALFDYKTSRQDSSSETSWLLGEKLRLEEVAEIYFRGNKGEVSLVKRDYQWFLVKPVKDFAKLASVASWVNSLSQKKLKEIHVSRPVSWKDYYLDAGLPIKITLKSGKVLSVSLAPKPNFQGEYFVRQGKRLLVGKGFFEKGLIEKSGHDFRSKAIINNTGYPQELVYRGKQVFKFSWRDYIWSVDTRFQLKKNVVNEFWAGLNQLEASRILNQPSSLTKYRLDKPQVKLLLKFKDSSLQVRISPFKKDKAFVQVSNRDYILEFDKKNLEKLLLTEASLRDHGSSFQLDKSKLASLHIQDGSSSKTLNKSKNSKELDQILNKIIQLKARQYKPGKLLTTSKFLELKDEQARPVWFMYVGDSFKKDKEDLAWVWLKNQAQKEWLALPKKTIDEIFSFKPETK